MLTRDDFIKMVKGGSILYNASILVSSFFPAFKMEFYILGNIVAIVMYFIATRIWRVNDE
jgi:hypothetical protein